MPFVAGFHLFWRELSFGSHKGNLRWQSLFRQGIEHYSGLIADGQPTAGRRWQVKVHVLVIGVDQHQYPPTRAKDFTGLGQAQLNDAVDRRT
ncbi:hypothetical protein D3C78_1185430 [compost metagenome]